MASRAWIGVDLDGTLAHYDSWVDELHIGDPIPLMVNRVKEWLAKGKNVKIVTARVGHIGMRDLDAVTRAIEAWCIQHIGRALPVTDRKDYLMVELWDDRAVAVEHNTGRIIGGCQEE